MNKKVFQAANGRHLVYSFTSGSGTPFIFINGLGDGMECWLPVLNFAQLANPCLLVDLPGQGESLQSDFQTDRTWDYKLTVDEQVNALLQLLDYLKIDAFGVVGFSYGGGIALGLVKRVRERISELILFLPFILRLDLSFPFSRLWVAQFEFFKSLTPLNLRQPFEVLEKSYERFIRHYMNFRYLGRIPDEKLRQVAVEISRGIMEFNSFEVIPLLPLHKLILVTSSMDTLVPQSLYAEFWHRIPLEQKKAWVKVINGEHLLLEQDPKLVAKILVNALKGNLDGESKVHVLKNNDLL
jgi:pimeloyl-ACP methyl ester carboxylesterase